MHLKFLIYTSKKEHDLFNMHHFDINWSGVTHMCYVIQTAEDVLPGLFGFKSCLFLMLFCCLKEVKEY